MAGKCCGCAMGLLDHLRTARLIGNKFNKKVSNLFAIKAFQLIVRTQNPFAQLEQSAGGIKKGAPDFMGNFYLHEIATRKPSSLAARHLRQILSKDVSTGSRCIHLVLRST